MKNNYTNQYVQLLHQEMHQYVEAMRVALESLEVIRTCSDEACIIANAEEGIAALDEFVKRNFPKEDETSAPQHNLLDTQYSLLREIPFRTKLGSKRESSMLILEENGLVQQGMHSYWYLTDAGKAVLAAQNAASM